jgi:drug/metabolite transporter (DMT)-like permease
LSRLRGQAAAFGLLAITQLLWAGNWVIGRAMRDALDPVSLNFWRWALAALAIAPFTLRAAWARREVLRRHAGILLLLALSGVALFQTLVYLGLRSTTAVNGVLINSSGPLFILLWSWGLERERATLRQVAGMLVSAAGIAIILCRGEPARLLELQFHAGDAWLLLAMPLWGLYSVLLKRRPPELDGYVFLFVIATVGAALLAPFYAAAAIAVPPRWPSAVEALGLLYFALGASVVAFALWNRGVAQVGASAAGFTLHLIPVFGTLLAIVFLGEPFALFHAVAFATILSGVFLATRRSAAPKIANGPT